MDIVIPIITLIVGLVGGFFIGAFYLRKQLEKMQSDPEALQKNGKTNGLQFEQQADAACSTDDEIPARRKRCRQDAAAYAQESGKKKIMLQSCLPGTGVCRLGGGRRNGWS